MTSNGVDVHILKTSTKKTLLDQHKVIEERSNDSQLMFCLIVGFI